ncbi:CocE/NonD family hydrolase [Pseudenhygromyxa sp. WMMC2535]|uniref:CocE/NonD family hydrolase n=1 Tax=Pseudenhygromyxa sp. WMMC2535 TaxID=2712867 RepID=UPI00155712DD|nr:CocE/NonD family hydrolase [Pseudenhygromyxa sp. WMMC2535]NVB43187.1 CocE/NonD family hydrolase [Pseudenhygromyxa sp. WMMC2535]
MVSSSCRARSNVHSLVYLLLPGLTLGLAPACGGEQANADESGESEESGGSDEDYVEAEFSVRESVNQLHITHALPGVELRVVDETGAEVAREFTDELGSLVFRELPAGQGYAVEEVTGSPRQAIRELSVWDASESLPDPSFYSGQTLQPGFNYITTRDGTTLSAYVTLPGPIEDGPYPTIVNYSGYQPSKPGTKLSEQYDIGGLDLDSLCGIFPVVCDAPNHPAGLIAGFLGYATVGVNMRGTGCSGGAYDFFEPLQVLDGYDVIETVAAQDWVFDNKVAMAGLSYPGLSQLWVAQSQPPSLAAIAPLSVFAHTADSVLRPGGITNEGFAINWAENVLDGAQPWGQGWEDDRIAEGDAICEENQLLHAQYVDVIAKIAAHPYYEAEIYDPLIPLKFVGNIDVPVFITGAWQDEQTGGHFPALFDALDNAPLVKMTMFNGVHADGYVPEHLVHWGAFLDFYIREEIPMISPELRAVGPSLFNALVGDNVAFPDDPYTMYGSYDEAFAAFEAEDPIKVLFEMGDSAEYETGVPQSSYGLSFDQWPPAEIEPERWYLQPEGGFAPSLPPTGGGGSSFHIDPDDATTKTLSGDIDQPLPPFNWALDEEDTAAVFVSEALAEDVMMIGPASADLWIRASVGEADLEVNVIEVRPDGQEMYVQSGWLRASERALDASASTELFPVPSHLESELAAVPTDSYVEARIAIFPFAHTFRAGSRIKFSVDTPGSSRPEWTFVLADNQTAETRIDVAHDIDTPSSVLLPVLPGQSAPTPLPPCPSLRGQPCREHLDFTNTPAQ